MQPNKTGILSSLASPFVRRWVAYSLLATGVGTAIGKVELDREESNRQTQSQVLDLKLQTIASRREQEARFNASLASQQQEIIGLRSRINSEKVEFQGQISALENTNRELSGQLEQAQNSLNQAIAESGNTSSRVEVVTTSLGEAQQTLKQTEETTRILTRQLGNVSNQVTSIRLVDIPAVVKKVSPSVVMVSFNLEEQTLSGLPKKNIFSGFLIEKDGAKYLVTCGHGFGNEENFLNKEIKIESFDGKNNYSFVIGKLEGIKYIVSPMEGDFACVELPKDLSFPGAKGLEFVDPSIPLQSGETVLALGSPLGRNGSVISGLVSRTFRVEENEKVIDRVDVMGLNPGFSGGPIVNADGKVVGMSVMTTMGSPTSIGMANAPLHLVRHLESAGVDLTTNETKTLIAALEVREQELEKESSAKLAKTIVGMFRLFAPLGEKPAEGPILPPLPGLESIPDLSIPPLPEPVAPEPEKIKPAPLPPIIDEVPPPPPEDEVLPKQNIEAELPAPPPPQ